MDEQHLLVRLVGDATARGITQSIDALARNHAVVDTGERSAWSQGRRLIVWRAVADGRL
jgi:hypothetical protein